MSDKARHGWYSSQSDAISGCSFYLNDKGEEVCITLVNDSSVHHGSGWKDIQYVGILTKYVGASPERQEELDMFDRAWKEDMRAE